MCACLLDPAPLGAWLPAGYEALFDTRHCLQPPADGEETLHCVVEDVRLGLPPRERALFSGESLIWAHEEDARPVGALLVTDARILFVPGLRAGVAATAPPVGARSLAARAVHSAVAEAAPHHTGAARMLLGEGRRRANRRGSDFCTTAAAAATDAVLPEGALAATISGAEDTDAAGFFGHTEYHVSVRARGTAWVVSRRYSEFAALRAKLAREGLLEAARFPGKRPFGDHGDRLVGLDAWLRAAVRVDRCRTFAPFLEFLDERGANHFNAVASVREIPSISLQHDFV